MTRVGVVSASTLSPDEEDECDRLSPLQEHWPPSSGSEAAPHMPSVRGGDFVYQTEGWFLLPLLQSFLAESHPQKEQAQALQSKPGEGEGGGGGGGGKPEEQ